MPYKHDYDKTLTRLRIILQRLNEGEALSVKELADEFNVSTRTIQRDFNERLVPHYPIYQENKKWKMQKGYKIEKIRDIEDKIILDILEKIVEGIGKDFSYKAKKLLQKLKNNDFNPIYAKVYIEDISNKIKDINLIENAIKNKIKLICDYKLYDKNLSIKIRPLKIINFEGFWYLLAQDDKNGLIKKYYLKNISNLKTLDESFTVSKNIQNILDNSISIWFDETKEPFEVTLFATKEIYRYFLRKPLPTQTILSKNDDGMKFSIKITHIMELLPIIYYWLPNLYVITPSWIKEEVKKDLKEYLKNIDLI